MFLEKYAMNDMLLISKGMKYFDHMDYEYAGRKKFSVLDT